MKNTGRSILNAFAVFIDDKNADRNYQGKSKSYWFGGGGGTAPGGRNFEGGRTCCVSHGNCVRPWGRCAESGILTKDICGKGASI